MIETEKKYKLTKEQFDSLRTFFRTKLQFLGIITEENTIYDADVLLRVRKNSGLMATTFVVTTKGDTDTENGIKSREEIEFTTQSNNIYKMLEMLKYKPVLVYEKNRECYNAPYIVEDVELALDELPFGYFLEIEGTIPSIAKLEEMLPFIPDVEMYSYPDLTNIYGKSIDGIMQARFA